MEVWNNLRVSKWRQISFFNFHYPLSDAAKTKKQNKKNIIIKKYTQKNNELKYISVSHDPPELI